MWNFWHMRPCVFGTLHINAHTSWGVCVYIYTHIHTCIHTYIHAYIHIKVLYDIMHIEAPVDSDALAYRPGGHTLHYSLHTLACHCILSLEITKQAASDLCTLAS